MSQTNILTPPEATVEPRKPKARRSLSVGVKILIFVLTLVGIAELGLVLLFVSCVRNLGH